MGGGHPGGGAARQTVRARHPDVPWKIMAGMRDVLIHGYDEIDLSEVWKTATTDMPALIDLLERILAEIGDGP